MEPNIYCKEERFDEARTEALKEHYAAVLRLLGEDPAREGLVKTPERVAKAMAFLTKGYAENPLEILRSAMFRKTVYIAGALLIPPFFGIENLFYTEPLSDFSGTVVSITAYVLLIGKILKRCAENTR